MQIDLTRLFLFPPLTLRCSPSQWQYPSPKCFLLSSEIPVLTNLRVTDASVRRRRDHSGMWQQLLRVVIWLPHSHGQVKLEAYATTART